MACNKNVEGFVCGGDSLKNGSACVDNDFEVLWDECSTLDGRKKTLIPQWQWKDGMGKGIRRVHWNTSSRGAQCVCHETEHAKGFTKRHATFESPASDLQTSPARASWTRC